MKETINHREQLGPSSVEKAALTVMGCVNEQVIAALSGSRSARPQQSWTGSTESWLSGADDDCQSGGVNNKMQFGNLMKSKPFPTQGKGISTFTFKKRPATISAIQPPDEWIEIEVTVDSGACETVMPSNICSSIQVHRSSCSHGAEYEVAKGESLPNLGERRCLLMSLGSNVAKSITFQVADVHKPLLSVSRCADMGFRCILEDNGGYLEHKSGERIALQRRDNLYVMKAWVKNDPAGQPYTGDPRPPNIDQGFARPQ